MSYFTKILRTQEGNLNFYFNSQNTVEGLSYHVSTIDKNRKSHGFMMHHNGSNWEFDRSNEIPDWLDILEPVFSQTITAQDLKETEG